MKILINASNLHVGGGVQVATSFIHELSLMKFFGHEFHVIVSEVVDSNLNKIDCAVDGFASYRVLNSHGVLSAIKYFRIKIRDYDVVHTIFGPLYSFIRPRRNVVGFAQPWIIYPKNELYNGMPFVVKLKSKFKYAMQRIFFSKSDILFVELEHVRKKLIDLKVIKSDKIVVVYNCLSSVYAKFQNN
jgi:glycosyltransferase involved in cell wall biosynthesis